MLTDEQRAEGWIDWHGGECPVPLGGPTVLVRLRCGVIGWVSPLNTKWGRGPELHPYDIIAYKPEVPND